MTTFLIILITSTYLISSIPFGLVLTKIFLKTDIRKIGSGNIGATNVLRTGSKWLALATVLLDALKPILSITAPFYLIQILMTNSLKISFDNFGGIIYKMPYFVIMTSILFSVLGHMFPLYLKFKGGKGVATLWGSLFLITKWYDVYGVSLPILPISALLTWLLVAVISKKSSLSALVALVMTSVYIPFMIQDKKAEFLGNIPIHNTYVVMSFYLVIVLLIFYKHKENIKRLLNGTESNISFKKSKPATETKKVAVKKTAIKQVKVKTTTAKNTKVKVKPKTKK